MKKCIPRSISPQKILEQLAPKSPKALNISNSIREFIIYVYKLIFKIVSNSLHSWERKYKVSNSCWVSVGRVFQIPNSLQFRAFLTFDNFVHINRDSKPIYISDFQNSSRFVNTSITRVKLSKYILRQFYSAG